MWPFICSEAHRDMKFRVLMGNPTISAVCKLTRQCSAEPLRRKEGLA